MTIHSALALTVAMFALAATPGPGVFATTSRALSSGTRSALAVIAGIVTGDIIYLLLAAVGLAALASTLGDLFVLVRVAGGAYLLFLGVRMWLKKPALPDASVEHAQASGLGNYTSGLVITLSNPKVIVFYGGFLPTFIDMTSLAALDVMAAALIVSVVLSSVMIVYAIIAGRMRSFVTSTRAARRLDRVAGTAMIATGAIVLARR